MIFFTHQFIFALTVFCGRDGETVDLSFQNLYKMVKIPIFKNFNPFLHGISGLEWAASCCASLAPGESATGPWS